MSNNATTVYNDNFYRGQRERSAASAEVVIPIVRRLVEPMSVLDVGCGVGTWVDSWHKAGLADVLGVDGEYVDRSLLQCSPEQFQSHDLKTPLLVGRRFDLVTCLEVAEHLPSGYAATLIESLVRHSDVVMFSAAVPRQGGTHHVNEQWPSYWAALFEKHNYKPYDAIRPEIWYEDDVEWWYRQNIILFASESAASRLGLQTGRAPLDIVHPEFLKIATDPVTLKTQLWERVKGGGKRIVANTPAEKHLRKLKGALT